MILLYKTVEDNTFAINFRIYTEDTDLGGVVYHANYLKFAERARSEMLRSFNINQIELSKLGLFFVVASCQIKYISPAKMDDEIVVKSNVKKVGKVSIEMQQRIFNFDTKELIADIFIKLGTVKKGSHGNFAIHSIPEDIISKFKNFS